MAISNKDLKIGLLEFGHRDDLDSLSVVQEIVNYAVEAENLGFNRFWLGEHHYTFSTHPWTSPDILLTTIAMMTENILLGSGGTLISLYSPYSVVTNFKMMNNLFSNRIELGVAKGFAESPYVLKLLSNELNKSNTIDAFNKNIAQIYDLLHNEEQNYIKNGVVIPPYGGEIPEVWYLGGSYSNTKDAIKYKMNFCRSLFHSLSPHALNPDRENLEIFRSSFYDNHQTLPKISLAIAVHIADTEQKAIDELNAINAKNGAESAEAWRILPLTLEMLRDKIEEYRQTFDVSEFIIYDTSAYSTQKIENAIGISELHNLSPKSTED